jgi:tetratricopeptide (TPR) repeat protein
MKTVKVFLASSEELKDDRINFGDLIRQLNDIFNKRGIEIKLLKWEDFNAAYTGMRKQDEYNEKIFDSDIFIALFHRKAGKFTLEEVDCAIEHFKEVHLPNIYIYVKELQDNEDETPELKKFKNDLLNKLGHYSCKYENTDGMKLNFLLQFVAFENPPADNDYLKVGSQSISIDGHKIVDLNNVSFASMNKEYNRLKESLTKSDGEINELRIKFAADPTDSDILGELVSKSSERNKTNDEFEKYQRYLYNTALKFTKLAGNVYSERIEKARALFEKGKVTEADQILNEEEMKKEVAQEIDQFEMYREHLESIIEEYLLKTETSMSNDKLSIKDRFSQACRAYNEAIKIAKKINYDREKIANIYYDYGELLRKFKNYSLSFSMYEESLSIFMELNIQNNNVYIPAVAQLLNNMANIHSILNCYDAALNEYEESLEMRRELATKKPGTYLPVVADTLNNMANLHTDLNHYKVAEKEYEESLKIKKELAEKNEDIYLPDVALLLNNLANLHYYLNDYKTAEKESEESLKIRKKLAAKNTDAYLTDVAQSLNNLANIQVKLCRYDIAEKEYEESLKIRRELAENNEYSYSPDVADTLYNMANFHCSLHCYDEAEKEYKESLEIRIKLAVNNEDVYFPDIADTLNNIGLLHRILHNYGEAENELNKSYKIRKKLTAKNEDVYLPALAQSLNNLAILHLSIYRYEVAIEEYNEYLEISKKLAKKDGDAYLPNIADTLNNLAILHCALHSYDIAEKEYEESMEIRRKLAEKNPDIFLPYIAASLNNLGNIHNKLQRYKEAEKEYEESTEIRRELVKKNPDTFLPDLASSLNNLGILHIDLHHYEEAEEKYSEALIIYKKIANNNIDLYKPKIVSILGNLSFYLLFLHRADEAESKAKEALSIDDSQLWIYTNLITSYIMQSKFEEADKIFHKIENEKDRIKAQLEDWKQFEEEGLFTKEQLDYVNKKRKELETLLNKES